MDLGRHTAIPTLVRIKPGALDRLGVYLRRLGKSRPLVLVSQGLPHRARVEEALAQADVLPTLVLDAPEPSFEAATALVPVLPPGTDSLVGAGGGKALDLAKYLSRLSDLPYLAVPTSLSNDGFASPRSSLTLAGRRRSFPAVMPDAVVIDTAICLQAPRDLWLSGVGDLAAKFTAVADWKRAFHARGTPVDDFAALLADASVHQFLARPVRDLDGLRLLGTALLLNGIAMSICGSSRPASGSEHLISHALDLLSARPRLHGLQVGVATYLVSLLQGQESARIDALFADTGFWEAVTADPFDRAEWIAAVRLAPTLKADFHTVFSERDCLPEVETWLREDPRLAACIRAFPG